MDFQVNGLVKVALAIMASIALSHPSTFKQEIGKLEYSILKECGKTNNWGDPSIFPRNGKWHVRAVTRLQPIPKWPNPYPTGQ